jgi:hypothetical protein
MDVRYSLPGAEHHQGERRYRNTASSLGAADHPGDVRRPSPPQLSVIDLGGRSS